MTVLDLTIIFGYLVGIVLFGVWFARKQKTTRDYFLGDRSVPWWAVAASIVATETSTITFISVPGIAFSRGGNFQFLQLVFGYLLGRIVISLLFIPSYFRGDLMTVYQLLDRRFGGKIKVLAASLFVIMRNIADGIRLLLTAIVLAAVYTSFQPGANADAIIIGSVILIGLAMIIFTYFGGMEAVIWVEVIQLGIYIIGAIAAAIILINSIDGGLSAAIATGTQYDKFSLFDFSFDLSKTFTFWAGLIGGCFLTMSTHGTDQYLVQRYLCTDRPKRAAAALLTSGAVVLGQFIGFLFIGVLLFAFYKPYADPGYAAAASGAFPFTGGDRVFPDFITRHMPPGLSGLVVAAIFAAAMSSSLNSIAATAMNDLYKPWRSGRSDQHYLKVSHVLTLVWGVVQILVAVVLMKQNRSALDMALSVASLINGPILGVFLVGVFLKRVGQTPALIGMIVSLTVMLCVYLAGVESGAWPVQLAHTIFPFRIAWPWYVLFGSVITLIVAWLASFAFEPAPKDRRDELAPRAVVD
ncbi:MAG TPA: sodium:solute symporter [Pyrinomonadaceae bacterium]|nr:sodium:solute symporter [Pyrinomonadaceae bacterium]